MKNECDIVNDLLFSYNDEVLTDTSKEFVEEHLKKCENCKKTLEEIKKEGNLKVNTSEIDFFKKIKKTINKKDIIITIVIIILAVIILFNIAVFNNYNKIASTMEIYLKDDITNEEVSIIKDKLLQAGENIELSYVSKDESLQRMKIKMKDKAYLLDGYGENVENPFRAFFELKTDTKIEIMVESVKDMKGVEKIVTHLNVNPYLLFFTQMFNK